MENPPQHRDLGAVAPASSQLTREGLERPSAFFSALHPTQPEAQTPGCHLATKGTRSPTGDLSAAASQLLGKPVQYKAGLNTNTIP